MSHVALDRTKPRGSAPKPPTDWEDEYRRLHEQHQVLKSTCTEQEAHIRRLKSQVQKLESDLMQMARMNKVNYHTQPRNKEEEDLVRTMYEQNAKLKSQVSNAHEKNRQLAEKLEKAKKAIAREKALNGPGPSDTQHRSARASHTKSLPQPKPEPVRDSLSKVAANGSEANLLAIAQKLKKKLSQAEEQNKIHAQELAKYRAHGAPMAVGNTTDLESELRDTKWKLQQLTVQHEALVSKNSSSGLLHRKQVEEYEESAAVIRTLKKTLEELTKEKERSDVKADKCEQLEQLVKELKASNRNLEESMNRLCEAPFINGAYGQANEVKNYDELLQERKDLMFKVNHLTDACHTHLAALKSMKMEEVALREEKDKAVREASELRAKYSDLETGNNQLSDKLKLLYGGDEGVTIEELERALTMVKRKGEHIQSLPFLDTVDDADPATIKKKYHEVQVMNLNLSKEVERLENMLKLQSTISKDLHRELENMVRKGDNDRRDLIAKNNQLESLSMKRQEKIQMLEAQLRQHLYAATSSVPSKGQPRKDNFMDNASMSDAASMVGDIQNDLLAELVNEKDGPVLPDENLMEVWVKSGIINEKVLPPGSSTFIVMDFFDYESQATSLVSGNKPAWDFAASFKIKVDDFFLRYFATDTIAFELNMAMKGDFRLLARCTVPLRDLLRVKPKVVFESCPMISPDTGEVICHLSIEMRLAIPISELYRLFLERHPTDRRYIEELSNKEIIEGSSKVPRLLDSEDESRLWNELEVTVLNASNIMHKEGTPMPCTYVYFQFLGFPDKFTNPVMDSTSPVFNERFGFPIITNDQHVRLLQRSTLTFILMDIKKEEIEDDDTNGYLGEIRVPLSTLGDGCNLTDTFVVKNTEGVNVGRLEVSIRWKKPFREQRELGPKALSAVDIERILSSFSSGDLYTGMVDYRAFCRFINPPSQVKRALEAIRKYTTAVSEKEKMKFEDVIRGFLGNESVMDEDKFIERMMFLSLDSPSGDYQALFRHIDTNQVAKISTDQVVAVLNMDEVNKIPSGLQEKLFRRTADMIARGTRPQQLFEEDDRWGVDGVISRTEFKECLKKMGFLLVDEEEAPVGASVLHDQRQEAAELMNDSVLSSGSRDEILQPSGGSAVEIADDVKKNREEFKAKVAEATRRSKQAAAIREMEAESHERNMESPSKSQQERRVDEVEMDQPEISASEHASGLSVEDNGNRDYDKFHMDQASDTIKSAFKEKRGVAEVRSPRKVISIAKTQGILEYEDKLRDQLSVNGVRTMTSLRDKFYRVDGKGSGFVTLKQFFHVVNQEAAIKLEPKEWKDVATYFDRSGSLEGIDYKAFINFLSYTPPTRMKACSTPDDMIFTSSSDTLFKKCDPNGRGYISRGDMLRVLSEVGYGHIATKVDMQEMITLFETKEAGLVNYNNFLEYCRQNQLSQMYDEVEENMKNIFNDHDLNESFQRIDVNNEGVITMDSLSNFFHSVDYPQPKSILSALMANMDTVNPTVNFTAFKEWMSRKPRKGLNFEGDLTHSEIKTKIKRYVTLLQRQSSSFKEQILHCYKHYDWRKPIKNSITAQEFYRSCKRAGFCLTESEAQYFATEFATREKAVDGSGSFTVDYMKFMEWCFGGDDRRRASEEMKRDEPSGTGTRHTTSDILKFLENKVKEGIDLIDVFKEYDPKGLGNITSDEFCLVLSSLGMSYLTQRDALDFAEYFKAAPGANYVMYKRIVYEIQSKIVDNSDAANIDVVDVICNNLLKKNIPLSKLHAELERYDPKQRGAMKSIDIGIVFENLRIILRRQEIEALCNRYAEEDTYYINYESLLVDLKSKMGDVDVEISASKSLHPEIVGKIRNHLKQIIMRGIDYAKEFDDLCDTSDACILQSDCKEILVHRLKIDLREEELRAIYTAYRDSHDPRRMNYSRMLRDCNAFTVSDRKEDIEVFHLADTLRQKIRRHCPDYRLPEALRGSHYHFCKKPSKKITEDSFAVGAKEIGMRLDRVQTRAIFDMMKRHSSGQNVSYQEFKVFVCDPFFDDVMWKFKKKKKNSEAQGITHKDLINSIKNYESRQMSSQQFLKALSQNDIVISESDAMRLMILFDPDELMYFDVEELVFFLNGEDDYGAKDSDGSAMDSNPYAKDEVHSGPYGALRKGVNKMLREGYTANEVFDIFDRNGRGSIDLQALREGAEEINVRLSRLDAKDAIRKMTLKGEGVIDRGSFLLSLDLAPSDHERRAARRYRRYESDEENEDPRSYNRRSTHKENLDATDANAVLRKFKRFLVERYGSVVNAMNKLTAAFEDVDTDNDGLITTKQLKECFTLLHSDMGGNEAYTLFESFDSKDTGKMKYSNLIDKMFTYENMSRDKGDLGVELNGIIKKLQKHMERESITTRTVGKVFKDRDYQGEGTVNKQNFSKCVNVLDLPLSDIDVDVVFQKFDSLDRGFIDYGDFLALLAPPSKESVARIIAEIKDALEGGSYTAKHMKNAFRDIDISGNGYLEKEEFLKAMRKIEIPIGIDKVNAIYAVYDIDNNGRLDYQEFVDMIHDAGSENSQWESNYSRRDKDRDYRDRRESREYDARYSSRKSRDYDDVRSSRDRDSYSSYRDERK